MPGQVVAEPHAESAYRRRCLNQEMGVADDGTIISNISVSSFFPIERYYDAADKVLASFEDAYRNEELDDAYVYGKRYCSFCINSIPQHDYYHSPKYSRLRAEHTKNVEVVMRYLEKVVEKMDAAELIKRKKREEQARIEAQRKEAERQRQEKLRKEKEAKEYQELLKRAERTRQTSKTWQTPAEENVEESALSKLSLLGPTSPKTPSDDKPPRSSSRYALSDTEDEEDEGTTNGNDAPATYNSYGEALPPPMPPPRATSSASRRTSSSNSSQSRQSTSSASSPTPVAPPPYDFAINSNRRNPFLGPSKNGVHAPYTLPPPVQPWSQAGPPGYGTVVGSTSLPDPPTRRHSKQESSQQPRPKKQKKVPVRHIRDQARRRYHELQQNGRIEIRPIDTYQGRYTQSTNGCTVISPLVVVRHLATASGVILPDHEIKDVIDNECGPLLKEIRGKLGLESHSLIIPSDVHDHLVDKKILKQEYFVGATGGNIISEEHMGEIFNLFKERNKAGAVLFFREHVISIIKIPVGNGKAYYDLVDSMPGTTDIRNRPCASRTRCKDINALEDLLNWYATKKFTDSNCTYIDRNEWNDTMADFDPRVFQAFVWGKPE